MANIDKEQLNWQLEQMSADVKELWLVAQQGDVEAQFKLGKAYYDVDGVAGWNEEETNYWLGKAAEQGHIQAQYLYIGLKSDDEQAVDWLRQLAEQGYAEAQLDLARAYQRGQKGIAQDHEQGIYWLRQAAEQEDVVTELTPIRISVGDSAQNEARQELGRMYQFGDKAKGVAKDYEQALFWYQKAAKHGCKWAESSVEMIQQEMQYFDECQQAAEQGDAAA
ncbi:MAG TPA: sel1 repeat family protein, partial [Thioploca sp.]|nr:sel1 repeat family protein [Thioploca sp.]